MATKGVNPFAKFQKAKKSVDGDVETKGELKKYGKEGSPKEEAFDKTEGFACGGKAKKFAEGGAVRRFDVGGPVGMGGGPEMPWGGKGSYYPGQLDGGFQGIGGDGAGGPAVGQPPGKGNNFQRPDMGNRMQPPGKGMPMGGTQPAVGQLPSLGGNNPIGAQALKFGTQPQAPSASDQTAAFLAQQQQNIQKYGSPNGPIAQTTPAPAPAQTQGQVTPESIAAMMAKSTAAQPTRQQQLASAWNGPTAAQKPATPQPIATQAKPPQGPLMGAGAGAGGPAMVSPQQFQQSMQPPGMKAGGAVKGFAKGGGIEQRGKTKGQTFAKGGKVDGIAQRGKTKGRIC